MDSIAAILKETGRENANIGNSPSAKMLQIASEVSKEYYLARVIPTDIARAHQSGDINIHDLDFYGKTLTCVQIPLGRLLAEGFNTGHGMCARQTSASAAALAAIIIQSCQNDMHGGQSFPFFRLRHGPAHGRARREVFSHGGAGFNLNSMHSRAALRSRSPAQLGSTRPKEEAHIQVSAKGLRSRARQSETLSFPTSSSESRRLTRAPAIRTRPLRARMRVAARRMNRRSAHGTLRSTRPMIRRSPTWGAERG